MLLQLAVFSCKIFSYCTEKLNLPWLLLHLLPFEFEFPSFLGLFVVAVFFVCIPSSVALQVNMVVVFSGEGG